MRVDVAVVGAGLAGLTCAGLLHRGGARVVLLDAADAVGGRVRTDRVEGFALDRGFQVLLSAYPEAQRTLDMEALDLRAFTPGALVRAGGRFERLVDPLRDPRRLLATAASDVGTLADKVRVLRLRRRVCRGTVDELFARPERSTFDALRALGFSPAMIEGFFRPFFGGIFLEPELATSSRMFEFVFRMFALGEAVLPARGMDAIPAQLAARLPQGAIRLGAPVRAVAGRRVELESGETIDCEQVVVAVDAVDAARLLGGAPRDVATNTCTTFYYAAKEPPVREPILLLDGERRGPVNHACIPSEVSASYAPAGQALVSATALGEGIDETAVRVQLRAWFGPMAADFRLLRRTLVRRALPRTTPGVLEPPSRTRRLASGVVVAGDHCETPSIDGALRSGRIAAQLVLGALRDARPAGAEATA